VFNNVISTAPNEIIRWFGVGNGGEEVAVEYFKKLCNLRLEMLRKATSIEHSQLG
jgi:hypothetical protein